MLGFVFVLPFSTDRQMIKSPLEDVKMRASADSDLLFDAAESRALCCVRSKTHKKETS